MGPHTSVCTLPLHQALPNQWIKSVDLTLGLSNTSSSSCFNSILTYSPLSEYAYYQIKEDYYNCRDTVNLSGQNYRQEENKYLKERLTYIKKNADILPEGQRGLSFTTLNRGMLKVKVTKNSILTNES
ncbi:hypothetical protein GWI33_022331 [Rhynchophorus ferrugineus]|uniref:Uncharacterized protein n=1 Tax=Rhynchophorus ferrugineus TaxID=354439 RepID=A0A834INH2_RHYFE|nr:hypothetical protein GWI33_022331 [Rhynchophorus ferrugineus]